jgi:hypothetical protein
MDVDATFWQAQKIDTLKGYSGFQHTYLQDILDKFENSAFATSSLWSMPSQTVIAVSQLCTLISSTTVVHLMDTDAAPSAEWRQWAVNMLHKLPSMNVCRILSLDDGRELAEDASFTAFKKEYMPTVEWDNMHVAWVVGDGNCMFNSIVCATTWLGSLQNQRVMHRSYCLRIAAALTMLKEFESFARFTFRTAKGTKQRIKAVCKVGEYTGFDELPFVSHIIDRTIVLLGSNVEGLAIETGCVVPRAGIDMTSPVVLSWSRFVGGNNDITDCTSYFRTPLLNQDILNHFVTVFYDNVNNIPLRRVINVFDWTSDEHSEDTDETFEICITEGNTTAPEIMLECTTKTYHGGIHESPTWKTPRSVKRARVKSDTPLVSCTFENRYSALLDNADDVEIINDHDVSKHARPARSKHTCSLEPMYEGFETPKHQNIASHQLVKGKTCTTCDLTMTTHDFRMIPANVGKSRVSNQTCNLALAPKPAATHAFANLEKLRPNIERIAKDNWKNIERLIKDLKLLRKQLCPSQDEDSFLGYAKHVIKQFRHTCVEMLVHILMKELVCFAHNYKSFTSLSQDKQYKNMLKEPGLKTFQTGVVNDVAKQIYAWWKQEQSTSSSFACRPAYATLHNKHLHTFLEVNGIDIRKTLPCNVSLAPEHLEIENMQLFGCTLPYIECELVKLSQTWTDQMVKLCCSLFEQGNQARPETKQDACETVLQTMIVDHGFVNVQLKV